MIPFRSKEQEFKNKICMMTIFLLPMMIDLSSGISFNISLSDLFLPILVLWIIMDSTMNKSNINIRSIHYIYILLIGITLVLNLNKILLTMEINNVISGAINVCKLIINIIYFCVFIYFFNRYKYKFEIFFLRIWMYSSLVASFMGIMGVVLYNFGIENTWSLAYRAMGPFNDPNLFATYLFICIGLNAIYNLKRKGSILGFNIILNLITIFLTSSRAAMITVVISLLILLIIKLIKLEIKILKKILKYIILSLIFIVSLYFLFRNIIEINVIDNILNRLINMGDSLKEDARILTWINAIKVWMNNPIMGSGIGTFVDVTLEMGLTEIGILAHNTYLSFLAETGIIGLISFIWFPAYLFILLLKNQKNNLEYNLLVFSFTCILISCISLNLENFRCMWIFFSYCFYKISNIGTSEVVRGEI